MGCHTCGSSVSANVLVCHDCPRLEPGNILSRLAPAGDAKSWADPAACHWVDRDTGRRYFALDADGDLIVAGGLQECTVALVEVPR